MVLITRLTEGMGLTEKGEAEKITAALKKFSLPTKWPDLNIPDVIKAISLDKKNRSGRITLSYIERIGQAGLLKQILKSWRTKSMAYLRINQSPWRKNSGSALKGMAHRAIICASLANGTSKIDNVVLSDDISATLGAASALGAEKIGTVLIITEENWLPLIQW